jgi:hypothetical protein
MITATMFDRRVISPCAIALGWYPSSSAAFNIRARVAGATLAPGRKQRETADCETPARAATS